MSDVRLRVYDPTNSTLQGTLDKSYGRLAIRKANDRGRGEFTVNHADTASHDLISRERVVRWQRRDPDGNWVDWHATIMETDPQVLYLPADEGQPSTRVAGPGLFDWWERCLVYPSPDLSSQETVRRFGPEGEIPVDGVPEPTTGGKVTRAGFRDRQAFRLVFDTKAVYRRALPAEPDRASDRSLIEFTCPAWTEARVVLDGQQLWYSPVGETTVHSREMPYDGEQHIIMLDGKGEPPPGHKNAVVWSWQTIREETYTDDEGNEQTVDKYTGLFRTFNSTTWDGEIPPTEPYWNAWEDYDTYPGVTIGYIVKTLTDEAQGRGWQSGATLGFDETNDSNGNPWPENVAHGFNTKQTVAYAIRQLRRWGCEFDVTPSGRLDLWIERGSDLTATVELEPAAGDTPPDFIRYRLTGPKIDGNVILNEADGGYAESVDTASVSSYGRLESGLEMGNSTSPDAAAPAVAQILAQSANPQREHVVDLSERGLRLLDDAELGDTIVGQTTDGTVPVRLTQQDLRQDDETGQQRFVLHAAPA